MATEYKDYNLQTVILIMTPYMNIFKSTEPARHTVTYNDQVCHDLTVHTKSATERHTLIHSVTDNDQVCHALTVNTKSATGKHTLIQ